MDNILDSCDKAELAKILETSFHSIVTQAEDWYPVATYIVALLHLQKLGHLTVDDDDRLIMRDPL